jgi:hypothetical protein
MRHRHNGRETSRSSYSDWYTAGLTRPVYGDSNPSSAALRITIYSFSTPVTFTTLGWLQNGLRWLLLGTPSMYLPAPGLSVSAATTVCLRMPLSTYLSALRVINPLTGVVGGVSLIGRSCQLHQSLARLRHSSSLLSSARRGAYLSIKAVRSARPDVSKDYRYSYDIPKGRDLWRVSVTTHATGPAYWRHGWRYPRQESFEMRNLSL